MNTTANTAGLMAAPCPHTSPARHTYGQPAAPAERAVSLTLDAEVMADLDDGRLMLVASTDPRQSDLDEVTPARLRGMVADARTRLAEFERLADEQEARDTLRAVIAEHQVELEEWDPATLDPKFRDSFIAFALLTKDGRKVVVVPAGQDSAVRLAAVRALLADMQKPSTGTA